MRSDPSLLSKRKRVLILLTGTFETNGGMVEYATAWAEYLIKKAWAVNICAHEASLKKMPVEANKLRITARKDLSYRRVAVSALLGGNGQYNSIKDGVLNAIEVSDPDLVFIVDKALFTSTIIKDIRSRSEVTILHTLHDPSWHEERISILARLLKWREYQNTLKINKLADVYMHVHDLNLLENSVFSDKNDSLFEMDFPPIPRLLPINNNRFLPTKVKGRQVTIGFIGRIEEYKGINIFLSSLEILARKQEINPASLKVVISGRGELDINRVQQLPFEVEVQNRFLTDKEFHEGVNSLDLLVLPYKSATFSGVGMLAKSYCVPLLVTNVGSLGALVVNGRTGFIIEEAEEGELASVIARVVQEPTVLKEMAKALLEEGANIYDD